MNGRCHARGDVTVTAESLPPNPTGRRSQQATSSLATVPFDAGRDGHTAVLIAHSAVGSRKASATFLEISCAPVCHVEIEVNKRSKIHNQPKPRVRYRRYRDFINANVVNVPVAAGVDAFAAWQQLVRDPV
jgi:hypothetical protein